MKRMLNIVAIATDITTDVAHNLAEAERLANAHRGKADIIVFPELFATGFQTDIVELHNSADNAEHHPVADRMHRIAAATNAAVCGTVATKADDGTIRNRCLFIEPSGDTTYYDKRHLFTMSREHNTFAAGNRKTPIVRFRGCNIALAVCYDLRFPCWMRNDARSPYDLLLLPAAWPRARQGAWSTLLAARAIENQAFVVGANRSGSDKFGTYDNLNLAFDPSGASIGAFDQETQSLSVDIDMDLLSELRHSFPVLNDAD